ncbi:MAG: type II toxin-antitoxin system HicA family toxin [Nitrospira sp.]
MGKLHVLSGRDVCRILEQHDFQIVRQHGSHIVMASQAIIKSV